MDSFLLDTQLKHFLQEDIEHGDITTDALFAQEMARARFVAREPLIACGMERVAARVFQLLGGRTDCSGMAVDGGQYPQGAELLTLQGSARILLRGERVALNLVQRLCGIATLTAAFVERVQGLPVALVDTRKTTPGLRMLEKYAVRCGGGRNHRYSLSDGVLLKDNHIAACGGSIGEAVVRLRERVPHTVKIEVECDTLEQVRQCLASQVDIIMLDNMTTAAMLEAVALIKGRALVEASGGVTLETVRSIAEAGVDCISIGALTHSAPAVDIGMDWR